MKISMWICPQIFWSKSSVAPVFIQVYTFNSMDAALSRNNTIEN